jgi:RimJ/RimL family protein N-acetyltransferase
MARARPRLGAIAGIRLQLWHTRKQVCCQAVRSEATLSTDLFRGRLVRLCGPRAEDAEVFARWSEDGAYRRWADTDAARPRSADHFRERDELAGSDPDNFEFRIRTIDDDRLVGFVAVCGIEWANRHGWVAVGLGEAADRGHGFGLEAVSMALRYAFHELALHRLSLDVIASNERAISLYRKLGFQEEGRLRERVLRDGKVEDLIYMGLLSRDWEQANLESAAPSPTPGG